MDFKNLKEMQFMVLNFQSFFINMDILFTYLILYLILDSHNIKIAQIKNTITYGDEKSNLNPLIMLFKLTYFIINNFYSKIKVKLQYSPLQVSGLQDLISQLFLFSFFYSILRFFQIRYFESPGLRVIGLF